MVYVTKIKLIFVNFKNEFLEIELVASQSFHSLLSLREYN
ncbi:hypothetical protein IGI44_001680 [Enterococcus sp. DIV0756]